MKTNIKQMLILAISIIAFATSCSKTDTGFSTGSSNTTKNITNGNSMGIDAMLNKSWRLKEIWLDSKNVIQTCELDNVIKFKTSGIFEYNAGMLCAGESVDQNITAWALSTHPSKINMLNSAKQIMYTYTVLKVESNQLLLSFSNGATYVYALA